MSKLTDREKMILADLIDYAQQASEKLKEHGAATSALAVMLDDRIKAVRYTFYDS